MKRAVLASLLGATLEWYDFILYGVVAGIVFNRLFFPTGDAFVSTMLAYATFAVGFVARPVGGIVFGHFGDRIGRKSMLVLTMLIMGVSTVMIGLLPTYEQVGIAAPLLLLLLRVLQGVALGGEWGGAVLMAYEHAPPKRRGLYASIPQIGLAIGLCLASGLVGVMSNVLTDAEFLAWGWRIGFVASALLVVLGLYVRLAVDETPAFRQARASGSDIEVPLFKLLRNHSRSVLLGMGARYIDRWCVFQCLRGVFDWLSGQCDRVPARQGPVGRVDRRAGDGVHDPALRCALRPHRPAPDSFVYQASGIFASGITPMIAAYLFEVGHHEPWLICAYVVFAALVSMASALLIGRHRENA
jgi:MHS family shikimate/dehydroshikimate transporter-like MFS transporter